MHEVSSKLACSLNSKPIGKHTHPPHTQSKREGPKYRRNVFMTSKSDDEETSEQERSLSTNAIQTNLEPDLNLPP